MFLFQGWGTPAQRPAAADVLRGVADHDGRDRGRTVSGVRRSADIVEQTVDCCGFAARRGVGGQASVTTGTGVGRTAQRGEVGRRDQYRAFVPDGTDTQATVTAIQPPGRYGALAMDEDMVLGFQEKPKGDGGWINGGFFVLSPKVLDYIDSDDSTWEQEPLITLAEQGQLLAYKHEGFWQAMDTLREKNLLEDLWQSKTAPWKVWK